LYDFAHEQAEGAGRLDATPSGPEQRQADLALQQVRVFISYRHDDTWGAAELLYDRLANRFGRENVFLDTHLQPGMEWLKEIKSHRDFCRVFLALIGPRWLSIMKARDQAAVVEPAEDYVRWEIQYALRPSTGIRVIPVLMGDVASYWTEALPRSLRALAKIEAAQVREKLFETDVERLISRLETIAREQPTLSTEPPRASREPGHPPLTQASAGGVPPPDAAHCEDVLKQLVRGNLVLFLGPRMTAGRGGAEGPASLPNAEELAAALADRFGIRQTGLDLPEIAQYIYVTEGGSDLYRAVRKLLPADCEPGPVYRFLARLPAMLEERGHEKRYPLIVSTNFDTALEQAFDDEMEPYDLAVYMASGPDPGKFVHFPDGGTPTPIAVPNDYSGFPIGLELDLERTVIVKIHGAVDGNVDNYRWKENYIITEDHYIGYLSGRPISTFVPVQVLDKLKDSHCLFLGYTVRDWNLRVFLKRIWEGRLDAKSWAVEPDPDVLEKDLWDHANVRLYAADLAGYVDLLQERLNERAPENSES
jgi:SIR2-like domain/TIR domain